MSQVVDLRSDTVTRPTPGMRRAMAGAEVGDDVYGEDPSVNALQEEVAALFGREAALYLPTGTMANQVALRVYARPATEVIIEADAHIVNYEGGAGAALAGVQFRTLPTADGLLDPTQVEAAVRPDAYHLTPTSLIAAEQTHNRRGGTVYPTERLRGLRRVADRHGVGLYIDGARILNAAAATGEKPSTYGELADALMLSLSKGLGAPVGSVLVGDADQISAAREWRRRYGGGMRQAGIIAAAGLYAVRRHVDRLAEDHANAGRLAELIAADHPGAVDREQVQTNMVYVHTGRTDAAALAGELAGDGVLVNALGPSTLRLVTHLDVDRDGCERAARVIAARL